MLTFAEEERIDRLSAVFKAGMMSNADYMRDLGLIMSKAQRDRQGITIADLKTKPVHPARLLADLAEEFDRGIEI